MAPPKTTPVFGLSPPGKGKPKSKTKPKKDESAFGAIGAIVTAAVKDPEFQKAAKDRARARDAEDVDAPPGLTGPVGVEPTRVRRRPAGLHGPSKAAARKRKALKKEKARQAALAREQAAVLVQDLLIQPADLADQVVIDRLERKKEREDFGSFDALMERLSQIAEPAARAPYRAGHAPPATEKSKTKIRHARYEQAIRAPVDPDARERLRATRYRRNRRDPFEPQPGREALPPELLEAGFGRGPGLVGGAIQGAASTVAGDLKDLVVGGAQMAQMVWGEADYDEGDPLSVVGLSHVLEMVGRGYVEGLDKMIPMPHSFAGMISPEEWGEELRSAGTAWKNDPLINVMTFIPFVNAASRPFSIGTLASRIAKANPAMTSREALFMAVKDSYRPGYAEIHGVQGGLQPRILTAKVTGTDKETGDPLHGKTVTVRGRGKSRTPLGRAGQKAYDSVTKAIGIRYPGFRFGEDRRAMRALERQEREIDRRIVNAIQEKIKPIRDFVFTGVGRHRGRANPARAAALIAALEGPSRRLDVEPAPSVKVTSKQQQVLDALPGSDKAPMDIGSVAAATGMTPAAAARVITNLDKKGLVTSQGGGHTRAPRRDSATPEAPDVPSESDLQFAVQSIMRDLEQIIDDGVIEIPRQGRLSDLSPEALQEFVGERVKYVEGEKKGVVAKVYDTKPKKREVEVGVKDEGGNLVKEWVPDEWLVGSSRAVNPKSKEFATRELSEAELADVELAVRELKHALENPADPGEFQQAFEALQELADANEQMHMEVFGKVLNEDELALYQAGQIARRDLIVNRLVRRGIIPEGSEARGYFPHHSAFDHLVLTFQGGRRAPARGRVIGRVRKKGFNEQENQLYYYQLGRVNHDPRVLLSTYLLRLRFWRSQKMAEELYDMGVPPETVSSADFNKGYLIRNPHAHPEKLDEDIYAALYDSPEEFAAKVERGETFDDMIDSGAQGALAKFTSSFLRKGEHPGQMPWGEGQIKNVAWVPEHIVETRMAPVFRSGTRGRALATWGTGQALARIALIYARPFRYVTTQIPQNIIMLAMTNPAALVAAARNATANLAGIGGMKSASLVGWVRRTDPELYDRIVSEGGAAAAIAGLPEFPFRSQNRFQAAERAATSISHELGGFLSRMADNPYRAAAWMGWARRYGFHTPDDWKRMLDAEEGTPESLARAEVAQRVRDDMIDFDTLSPYEREVVGRIFFLWSFTRGITKWPFMYMREHPLGTGIVAAPAAALEQPQFTTAQDAGVVGSRDLGWLHPFGPAAQTAEQISETLHGNPKALTRALNPGGRISGEVLFGGSDISEKLMDVAKATVPFISWIDAARNAEGQSLYMSMFDLSRYGHKQPNKTVKRKIAERKAKLEEAVAVAAGMGLDTPDIETIRYYWEAWKTWVKLRDIADRSVKPENRKLTLPERVSVLLAVAEQYNPGAIEEIGSIQDAQEVWDRLPSEQVYYGGKLRSRREIIFTKLESQLDRKLFAGLDQLESRVQNATR